MSYVKHVTKKNVHKQTEQAREDQILNSAGGFSFEVSPWDKLNRFLILGSEKGSYYVSEKEQTIHNYDNIKNLLPIDYKKVIDTIIDISQNGRAPKNNNAVFALAVCSVFGSKEAKEMANKAMPLVCRFSTDLFSWVNTVNELKEGKKSKGLQRSIGRWYNSKDASFVAYQICKYPGRTVDNKRWTHADLLKIAYILPKNTSNNDKSRTASSSEHEIAFKYAIHGVFSDEDIKTTNELIEQGKKKWFGLTKKDLEPLKEIKSLEYIWAHEQAKNSTDKKEIISLIKKYKLTTESIPTDFLKEKDVLSALLQNMPMTAMLRKLGQYTAKEVLKPLSKETSLVIDKLSDKEFLKKSRIHPMTLFICWKIYQSGCGEKGSYSWDPIPAILSALENAFYLSFDNCEKIDKNIFIGVDVSPSMFGSKCAGNDNVSAAEAAAVISMVIMRSCKNYQICAFQHKIVDMKLTSTMSFNEVINKMEKFSNGWGGTDCSAPILQAINQNVDVDTFITLTDNETWHGTIHPFEALKKYRSKCNSHAKIAYLSFTSNNFSLADKEDKGCIDIVGLDSHIPQILSDFIQEKF